MRRVQKDLVTRVFEVTEAWERMRSQKKFYGLDLGGFKLSAHPYLEAREVIANLELELAHAVSKRDAAAAVLTDVVQGVVNAVKGDPEEGQYGELYAAMGYVPKNQRSTGLVRRRRKALPEEGGDH